MTIESMAYRSKSGKSGKSGKRNQMTMEEKIKTICELTDEEAVEIEFRIRNGLGEFRANCGGHNDLGYFLTLDEAVNELAVSVCKESKEFIESVATEHQKKLQIVNDILTTGN